MECRWPQDPHLFPFCCKAGDIEIKTHHFCAHWMQLWINSHPTLSTIGQNPLDTSNRESEKQMCFCPNHVLRIPIMQTDKSQPNCHYPESGKQPLLTCPCFSQISISEPLNLADCPGLLGEPAASCLATRAYKLVSAGLFTGLT